MLNTRHPVCFVAVSILFGSVALGQAGRPDMGDQLFQAERLIRVGDPTPLPMVIEFLERSADDPKPAALQGQLIHTACRMLRDMPDKRAAPVLRKLALKRNENERTTGAALVALARIGDPEDTEMLLSRLNDDLVPWRDAHQIASAMALQGNEKALDFLVEEFSTSLDIPVAKRDINACVQLEYAASPLAIDKVSALLKVHSDKNSQRDIGLTISFMKRRCLPMEELLKLAENRSGPVGKDADIRLEALGTIGDRGTPDMIPALMALKPWDQDKDINSPSQQVLRRAISASVYRIQQRHADAIAKSGSKLVRDVEDKLRARDGASKKGEEEAWAEENGEKKRRKPGAKETAAKEPPAKELGSRGATDRYGPTILADGSDIATNATHLQFRLAGDSGDFTEADELIDPVSKKKLSVQRYVFLNENGLKGIVAGSTKTIDFKFKPEVLDRMQQFAKEYPTLRLAIVLDGRIVALMNMPKFRAVLSINDEDIDRNARAALLKLMAQPAGPVGEKAKAPPAN
jgi:HEAT repeat protein